jgi:hypothetical protein
MNQDQASNLQFTIKLNTAAVSGTKPLKINVNANLSNEYSDVISAQSTLVLVFNANGTLVKKYEYTLAGHAASNLPPTLTQYGATPVAETPSEDRNPEFEIAKLYPNPTNAKFNIQLNKTNAAERKFEIEVFDIEGRLVLTKSSAAFVKGKEEVDLLYTSMASGVYIVRVKYDEILRTAKVVLAK